MGNTTCCPKGKLGVEGGFFPGGGDGRHGGELNSISYPFPEDANCCHVNKSGGDSRLPSGCKRSGPGGGVADSTDSTRIILSIPDSSCKAAGPPDSCCRFILACNGLPSLGYK